ncbi:MAG: SET domain-containing protein [Chlamydiae bacterium]|nr:SET domain-containing protein [Chlamydiota bacterium]
MKDYCPSSESKKRSIDKDEVTSESKRHLTELGKNIHYTPLAFLPEKTKASWERSTRACKRISSSEEIEKYRKSRLYAKAKKVKELIEKRKNDDFLTKKFSVTSCGKKGLGLRAAQPIKAGEVITFYGGKIVDVSQRVPKDFEHNHYLFGLPQEGFCIDGEFHCSHGSVVNHGKKPNAFAFLFEEDDEPTQVAYIASKPINPGDEIEINYDDGRVSPLFFEATGEKPA